MTHVPFCYCYSFTIDNYFNGTCLINAVINVEAVQRLPALATDPNKVYLLGARNIGDCGKLARLCSNQLPPWVFFAAVAWILLAN